MVLFNSRIIFLLLPLIATVSLISCQKSDKLDPNPALMLSYSTDTVFFDTVFPSIGSVTHRLTVYNENKNKVNISKIFIAGGVASNYRININGLAATSASDIELNGRDSLFIFVKVTIDPNNQSTPYVVDDSLGFEMNNKRQYIKLVAWGRNAIFHKKTVLQGEVIWDSTRAHVIYGSLRVDTNSKLIILPGSRVYFHKDAYLAVSYQASLKIPGSLDHPVRIQGDRMDEFYKDLPGQWAGIFLEAGSRDNELNYVTIKNGVFGVVSDSVGSSETPALVLNNCIIYNTSSSGLLAYGTSINSFNCVFGNCGGPSLEISNGGSYDFRQLTIGNYWTSSVRNVAALAINNYTYDTLGNKILNPLTKAYFGNLILYGSNTDEMWLDSASGAAFNFQFDHAILKTTSKVSDPSRYINCLVNKDPRFVEPLKMNYMIDSISPAIAKGKQIGIALDIKGVVRGDTPSLGAYEYVKKR